MSKNDYDFESLGLPPIGSLEHVRCETPRFVSLSKVSFIALVSLLSYYLYKSLYRKAFCELLDFSSDGLEDLDLNLFPNLKTFMNK